MSAACQWIIDVLQNIVPALLTNTSMHPQNPAASSILALISSSSSVTSSWTVRMLSTSSDFTLETSCLSLSAFRPVAITRSPLAKVDNTRRFPKPEVDP